MNTNRVFLVGCPRSGTTLLQSMAASHPQVVSFPETHFFSKTLPINPLLRRIKLYGTGSRKVVTSFLSQNGYTHTGSFADSPPFLTHNRWCQLLLQIIDEMTAEEAKNLNANPAWGLEKTPRHLFYISSIQQKGYENKFLHILRHGPDVVASLYLATQNYPKQWGGARSIKKCIKWWNNSIRESLKYQDHPDHLITTYEQLLNEPKIVLRAICDFLDLEYQEAMMSDFHSTAGSLTKDEEKWKQKNVQQSLDKSNKLEKHFDSETISYIQKNVLKIDLTQFQH